MICDSGLSLGQGASFVKYNGFDVVGSLQGIPSLDEDPAGGSHSSAHHDGCGGGQSKGTGAGNDQHRDAKQQRKQEVVMTLWEPLIWISTHCSCNIPASRGTHSCKGQGAVPVDKAEGLAMTSVAMPNRERAPDTDKAMCLQPDLRLYAECVHIGPAPMAYFHRRAWQSDARHAFVQQQDHHLLLIQSQSRSACLPSSVSASWIQLEAEAVESALCGMYLPYGKSCACQKLCMPKAVHAKS